MRDSGFLRRLPNPAGHFVHYYVIVRGVSAQQAPEADDGIVLLGFGQRARGGRNLKRARNADDRDVLLPCAGANQSVVRASQQSIGNELVEAGNNNSEGKTGRAEATGNRLAPDLSFGIRSGFP